MITGQISLELKKNWQSIWVYSRMKQGANWRTSDSTRYQMEVQPTCSPHTLEECGKDWLGVARKQFTQCWAIDQSRKMFCQPRCVLSNRQWMVGTTDIGHFWCYDLEAITLNQLLLGNKNLCLPYLSGAEQFFDPRKLFRQTQAYADLIWDRFRKE